MTHFWIRAESRPSESRVAVTPAGVAALVREGHRVTVEESPTRVLPMVPYERAGAEVAAEGSWPGAPRDAVIVGLKELPEDGSPLPHVHVMFGHAYKDQSGAKALLRRFVEGGGTLLDLEYLTDAEGRRVAAFGQWAGFMGAAVSVLAYAAQARGETCPPVETWESASAVTAQLSHLLDREAVPRPDVLIVGAKGRVGTGAAELCRRLDLRTTLWDVEETETGGPFPQIMEHGIFLNCILARPGCPVFVPAEGLDRPRALGVIGDIACDPTSPFNPVPVYDAPTTWEAPAVRVHVTPPLDVMAIDNLPSLLPAEASEDFAAQLLPHLLSFGEGREGPWGRSRASFEDALEDL